MTGRASASWWGGHGLLLGLLTLLVLALPPVLLLAWPLGRGLDWSRGVNR